MAGMPEIGSKISLISKADIRYEGKLFTVDPTECTIALACVRSYGTEDREVENPVPPQPQTYDFILFRGSDIKDIRVVTSQLPNDPAIVQMTVPPSINSSTYQPHGFSMPSMGQVGSSMSSQYNSYNPMSSMAPGMGRSMPKQQSQQSELMPLAQVPEQVQSPLKDHPVSSSELLGGGSRSSTPGLLSSGPSRKSPSIDQGVQVSAPPQRRDDKFHSRNVQFQFDSGHNQYNRDGNRSRTSGVIGERPYHSNSYRQNDHTYRQRDNNYRQNDNRGMDQNRQQRRSTYILDDNQQQLPLIGGMQGQFQRSQGGQGYGGMMNRGNWVNRGANNAINNNMRQRGRGRSQQGQIFNRAPGQQIQQQLGSQNKKHTLKFEGDYDFDKANNEFEELRSQLTKVKISDPVEPVAKVNGEEIKDDSGNETVVGEGDHDVEEAPVYYDKAKSFFDNISCEAVERSKGRSQRTDWRTERKLNSETFGVASARRGGYRGRGGYYNMGRGMYRGGGGMGGAGGRMNYNNNRGGQGSRPKPASNNPMTNNRPQVATTNK